MGLNPDPGSNCSDPRSRSGCGRPCLVSRSDESPTEPELHQHLLPCLLCDLPWVGGGVNHHPQPRTERVRD
jgi:hypothetical protein